MNIKKLLTLGENVEKLLYEMLNNCEEKARRDLYLPFGFYSIGGNLARLQFSINTTETYKYLLDALKSCVVIEYYTNLIGKCKMADVDSVLQAVKKLKKALIKEKKSFVRVSKADVRSQGEWRNPLLKVVKEQLSKFDTYDLITDGCSQEIFAEEAQEIVNQMIPNANVEYVTNVIANVMEKSYHIRFEKDRFFPFASEICTVLGETVEKLSECGEFAVYYKVVFEHSGYEYSYTYCGNDICVGDYALVPVGTEKIKTPARLSGIQTIFRKKGVAPDEYPNFKSIFRKIDFEEYEEAIFIDDYHWE